MAIHSLHHHFDSKKKQIINNDGAKSSGFFLLKECLALNKLDELVHFWLSILTLVYDLYKKVSYGPLPSS